MNRVFPKEVENSQNNHNNKTGQKIKDASKYRTISLINVGGKVLEKILSTEFCTSSIATT